MQDEEKPYILLIEDSPSQALQLKLYIQRYTGYEVQIAHDGAKGWKWACTVPSPRLIFLDVNLPVFNGFQVLSRLKRNRATAHIPVIMMTTSDTICDVERALSLGADDYLFKNDWMHSAEAAFQQLQATIESFLV